MIKTNKKDSIFFIVLLAIVIGGIIIRDNLLSVAVFPFLWIILVIVGGKITTNTKQAFSITNSNALKGWAAVEIMIGHLGLFVDSNFLFANRKAGIFFVGLFFVLSGYGLSYGVNNKTDYLQSFLKNKCKNIFIPSFIVIVIYGFIFRSGIYDVLFGHAIWYIWELMLLYVIFYVANKLTHKWANWIIFIVTIILTVTLYLCGADNPWYGSALCFPLGCFIYVLESKKSSVIKAQIGGFVVSVICCGICSIGFMRFPNTLVGSLICRNIASVCFCILVYLILSHVIIGNSLLDFFSEISFELYLVHFPVMKLISLMALKSNYLFCLFSVVLSILIAVLFHFILKIFR